MIVRKEGAQKGYVLLLVATALLMISIATLSLFEGESAGQSQAQTTDERFALQTGLDAGIAHNLQALRAVTLCSGYPVSSATLGEVSYVASLDTTFSSPIELTVTATHSSGRSVVRSQTVQMYSGSNNQELESVGDAEIDEDKPTDNFGDKDSMHARTDSGDKNERVLMQFDVGLIPKTGLITSARLRVTLDKNGGDDGLPDQVFRILSAWDEDEVTWNRPTSGFFRFWMNPGGDVESVPFTAFADSNEGAQVIDLTYLARLWQQGTDNHGVMLSAPVGLGEKHFHYVSREDATFADRPKLIVDYRCDCQLGCV